MKATLMLAWAIAATAALAQTPEPDPDEPDAGAAVQLAPKTENGITYLCGGVGAEEAARLEAEAPRYDLMLTFAENTGEYLAGVGIAIDDAQGKPMLQTSCHAPIMLVKFPHAGSYRVTAEVAGQSVSRLVHIGAGKRQNGIAVTWPRSKPKAAQPVSS